jgi:hypothetical protein
MHVTFPANPHAWFTEEQYKLYSSSWLFTILLLLPIVYVQIFSSALCSEILFELETKIQIHISTFAVKKHPSVQNSKAAQKKKSKQNLQFLQSYFKNIVGQHACMSTATNSTACVLPHINTCTIEEWCLLLSAPRALLCNRLHPWFEVTLKLLWVRCQETTSGECNRLRTLVCVTVNCKLWK